MLSTEQFTEMSRGLDVNLGLQEIVTLLAARPAVMWSTHPVRREVVPLRAVFEQLCNGWMNGRVIPWHRARTYQDVSLRLLGSRPKASQLGIFA